MKKLSFAILTIVLLIILIGCAKEEDNKQVEEFVSANNNLKNTAPEESIEAYSFSSESSDDLEQDDEIVIIAGTEKLVPMYEGSIDEEKALKWQIDELVEETRNALESYKEYYLSLKSSDGGFVPLTKDNSENIVRALGDAGYAVANVNFNMPNYETIQSSATAISNGEDASLGIYQFEYDGRLIRNTFISQDGEKVFFRILAGFDNSGTVTTVVPTTYANIPYTEFTEKGYFLYGFTKSSIGPSIGGFRVLPIADKNRELARAYIEPLGYAGHTALTQNWSENDFSHLNFMDLFDTLYKMKFEEEPIEVFKDQYIIENSYLIDIPANIFEETITEYFRVPVEHLRQDEYYNEAEEVYMWHPYGTAANSPVPEVVSYTENSDHTITLVVDAVMLNLGQDRVFTSTITILPKADGSCYYISNGIDINPDASLPLFMFGESRN